MKHIAIPARRISDPSKPYTCTGLGDRIHSAIVGWVLAPSTLHLTADKFIGGQFGNKPESWAEIFSLFPGSIEYKAHSVSPRTEAEWLRYLGDPLTYYYGDYEAKYERREIDISPLLECIPRLTAEPVDIELPERFCTVQWDANGQGRTIPESAKVLERYRAEGLTPVTVGGQASGDLRWSLKHIAYAMSKAECHVGVDSGFFHLAQLYMPWERIHLYSRAFGHHVLRAKKFGAKLNLYL